MNFFNMKQPLARTFLVCAALALCVSADHDFEFDVTWTEKAPLPYPRSDMSATTVVHNRTAKVYVIGGCASDQIWIAGSEGQEGMYICPSTTPGCTVFNPNTNTHQECASAPRKRYRHAAANVKGKVWLVGGRTEMDDIITEVDVYDPDTDTWATPYVWEAATSDLAVFAVDSVLYLIGGYEAYYAVSNRTSKLDTQSLTITQGSDMLEKRGDIAAAHLDDNTVYVTGGFGEDFCNPHDTVERYDVAENKWTKAAPLMLGRGDKSLVGLKGRLYAVGGEHKDTDCSPRSVPVGHVEVYDPIHDKWVEESKIPEERFRFVAAAVSDQIYIFGGQKFHNSSCNCYQLANDVLSYSDNVLRPSAERLYSGSVALQITGVIGAVTVAVASLLL